MRAGGILRVLLETEELSGERALSHGTLGAGRYLRLIFPRVTGPALWVSDRSLTVLPSFRQPAGSTRRISSRGSRAFTRTCRMTPPLREKCGARRAKSTGRPTPIKCQVYPRCGTDAGDLHKSRFSAVNVGTQRVAGTDSVHATVITYEIIRTIKPLAPSADTH
jgi:hypothetical protein